MSRQPASEQVLQPAGHTRLEIDLDKAAENYRRICAAVAPAAVMAVLKDNAYGHGLVRYARHLYATGCRHYGVATLHEALTLSRNGLQGCTLLILRALTEIEIPTAISSGFEIVVADLERLRYVERFSKNLGRPARVHIKLDTGLGRLGFLPDEVPGLVDSLRDLRAIEVIGVASHFAASAPRHEFHGVQLERFKDAVERIQTVRPGITRHIAASAATVGMPESWLDMIRVSSLLYGLSSSDHIPWGLETTLTWKAPLLQVKTVPPQWNVGYDLRYAARDHLRVGTIAVGAGDGFSYAMREKASVLVRGQRCRVIGMALDQSMLDLTNAPEAVVGDDAVIVGASGGDVIRPEELARIAGTSYGSILSTIPPRLPRFYFEGGCLRFVDTLEDTFHYE